jgi:hypothetical protein
MRLCGGWRHEACVFDCDRLCVLCYSLSLTLSHARALSLSFCLSRLLACSLARSLSLHRSLSHTHSHSLARTHATSLSLSLTHTHTRSCARARTHTHTNTHTILPLSTEHADTRRHVTVGASALRFSFLFSDGVPARRGARGHFDCGRRHRRRG